MRVDPGVCRDGRLEWVTVRTNGTHRTTFRTGLAVLLLALVVMPTSVASGRSASATKVDVHPLSGLPGTQVTVTGKHFKARRRVNIYIVGKLVGRVRSNSKGSFKKKVTVPSNRPTGTLSLRIYSGRKRLVAKFTVTTVTTATENAVVTPTTTDLGSTSSATPNGTTSSDATSSGTTTSGTTSTTAGDVVLAAAGDIACMPGDTTNLCKHLETADVVRSINPNAVALLGDNQYESGTLSEYQGSFALSWGALTPTIYPAPGNHEYYTSNASGYYSYFGTRAGDPTKGYYSYDLGNWHLIALNTNDECTVVACDASSAQVSWLNSDLAAHTNSCTLAYWHHPRFSSGSHGNDTNVSALWTALYSGGTDVVLNGHDHNYERFAPQNPSGVSDATTGIREFIVGTGGKSHYATGAAQPNSEARNSDTFGVLKLALHASSYDWEFVPVSGGTFTDSGTSTCH